jgi:hypothetical protein
MSKCVRCGYLLEGLPENAAGRIVCPECANEQAPGETVKTWGGTRACLVTSLAVQLPLFASMLVVGLSVPTTEATLVPLSFGVPLAISTIAGGFAGYRAACRRDPTARERGVERVWWPVVSLLFNGVLWLATMAVAFLILARPSSAW